MAKLAAYEWGGDRINPPIGDLKLTEVAQSLNETQWAIVAAKIANLVKGQTLRAGPPIGGPVSQPEAAELLNVGERSVEAA